MHSLPDISAAVKPPKVTSSSVSFSTWMHFPASPLEIFKLALFLPALRDVLLVGKCTRQG